MLIPSCFVCSGKQCISSLAIQTAAGEIPYFQCSDCSLIFQDPGVSFKESEIYNADYILKRSQDPGNLNISRPREKTAEHYYTWVEKFVPKGNLLEIGCATGIALKVAKNHGWNVFGVEVNEQAATVARKLLGSDVIRVGNFNNDMFPDEYFSLITLFDVLEHIPHPVEFLTLLHKKLAPGGSILFVTPTIDSLSFKILKEKWPHFVQEHLLLYSTKSINQLLTTTHFLPKKHGWAIKYLSIEMLKTHCEHHPQTFFYKPIRWLLRLAPTGVIPFNVGEMFVFAQKIS
ncbi:MAG: class I SAM-dependent methyltransferase [Candidatus Omnitrophica bacterium]|nr:class I SAM-dependent methyltransferase [Candidatus Omnitrophota bacterium]